MSTTGQLLDRQILALTEAGCQRIFTEKKSGRNAEREELAKCLDYLRATDTFVVPSLDRLGRSLQDLISIVAGLRRRGIGFCSLHEALDTTTPVVASSSTSSPPWPNSFGTDRARHQRRPRRRPRPRPAPRAATGDAPEQISHAHGMLTRPDVTVASIARVLGVSRSTIYDYVPELGPTTTGLQP